MKNPVFGLYLVAMLVASLPAHADLSLIHI